VAPTTESSAYWKARGDHLAHAVEHFLESLDPRAALSDRELHDGHSFA
jgi:hypothetical protein